MRNSPQRRERKRLLLIEELRALSDEFGRRVTLESAILTLQEALIFLLEERCHKKTKQ